MKILLYIDSLNRGGAERVMANLANTFSEKGEDIILVNSFPEEMEYKINPRVKRYYLEKSKPQKRMLVKKNITRIYKLRKILKKEHCNVALSFSEGPNFRLIFSTRFLPIRTIISVRSDPKIIYSNTIYKIMANLVYSISDACVFQTEEARDFFGRRVKSKSVIILNPVSSEFYKQHNSLIKGNVVSLGRLEECKNFQLLISAFSKICNEFPDDNLLIYGEGTIRTKLEEQIKTLSLENRVYLPGRVNDVAEKIRDAKVYVLSSNYEGLPNGLMEAMALGIPVVSTDCPCGGPDLLLEHGKYGILTHVNNEEELVHALRTLLRDPLMREQYSSKCKERSRIFELDKVCEDWKRLFDEKLTF